MPDVVALLVHYAVGTPVEARIVRPGETGGFAHDYVEAEVLPYDEAVDRLHEVALQEIEIERRREEHKRELAERDSEPGSGGGGGGGATLLKPHADYKSGSIKAGSGGGGGGSNE